MEVISGLEVLTRTLQMFPHLQLPSMSLRQYSNESQLDPPVVECPVQPSG